MPEAEAACIQAGILAAPWNDRSHAAHILTNANVSWDAARRRTTSAPSAGDVFDGDRIETVDVGQSVRCGSCTNR